MNFKDLEKLRDKNGYVDISSLYDEPNYNTKISLDDTDIFWKTGITNGYSHLTELIASELAKQMGIPTTTYHLAKCNGVEGVISKNVVEKNETLVNYNSFLSKNLPAYLKKYYSTVSVMELYDILKQKIYYGELDKENANELLNLHIKLLIFDDVVINTDRHAEGNLILVQDKNNKIKLRPIDNEMSLLSHFPSKHIHEFLNSGKIEAIIKNEVTTTNGVLTISAKTRGKNNYLLNLTETKQFFPKLFEGCMNKVFSLDLNSAIKTVEKEQKTALPKEYKQWITLAFNERLETIKDHFYDVDFIKPQHNDLEV